MIPLHPFGPMRPQARPRCFWIGPRVVDRCLKFAHATNDLLQEARTPSQILTRTMRRADRPTDWTGSRFPAVSRSAAVTPRGGRSCRFDETAYGTERFLGRDVKYRCRPLTRPGRAGLTP
jgi:hypothetical protein